MSYLNCLSTVHFFFFNDTATTEIYTLSLHDALPIFPRCRRCATGTTKGRIRSMSERCRSEEHTSELQSQSNLVCRLLLEKKKKNNNSVDSQLHIRIALILHKSNYRMSASISIQKLIT